MKVSVTGPVIWFALAVAIVMYGLPVGVSAADLSKEKSDQLQNDKTEKSTTEKTTTEKSTTDSTALDEAKSEKLPPPPPCDEVKKAKRSHHKHTHEVQ